MFKLFFICKLKMQYIFNNKIYVKKKCLNKNSKYHKDYFINFFL